MITSHELILERNKKQETLEDLFFIILKIIVCRCHYQYQIILALIGAC